MSDSSHELTSLGLTVRSSELAGIRDLEALGAITPVGIELPAGTSMPRIEALFIYFGRLSNALRWYIGDLINFGERTYGDRIHAAAEETGLSPGTLQNYASVAGRIPRQLRRPELSFSTHIEVAYLNPALQEKWLGLAVENSWSRSQLRELLTDEGLKDAPQPAWSRKELAGAASEWPVPAGSKSHSERAEPGGPTSTIPGEAGGSNHPAPSPHPHALTIARMRDRLDDTAEREALTWALEVLAPEYA